MAYPEVVATGLAGNAPPWAEGGPASAVRGKKKGPQDDVRSTRATDTGQTRISLTHFDVSLPGTAAKPVKLLELPNDIDQGYANATEDREVLWYNGVIMKENEVPSRGKHGPIRHYSIQYDEIMFCPGCRAPPPIPIIHTNHSGKRGAGGRKS